MKLNAKVQAELHEKLGAALLEMLNATPCTHCNRSYPTAKDLTVIRQFLADNGTTADLRSQTPLHSLAEALPSFEDPEERVTKPSKKRPA
jgi:hypothetical protein